jgi:hypothetical protein
MKKYLAFFLVSCFCLTLAQAQTAGALLRETALAYQKTDFFSADVRVHTFSSTSDQTGTLVGDGLIRKAKQNYYSKFGDDELLVNANCALILDHAAKTATWFDGQKKSRRFPKTDIRIPDLDSLLQGNDSLVFRGTQNGERHFTIFSKQGYIHHTEIFIDAKTLFIKQLSYFYRQDLEDASMDAFKLVVQYRNIETKRPSDAVFSEKKYVAYQQGRPVMLAAYRQYELSIAE